MPSPRQPADKTSVFQPVSQRYASDGPTQDSDLTDPDHAAKVAALRWSITDVQTRAKRLARNLELVEDADRDLVADITERRAELRIQQDTLEAQLTEAQQQVAQTPNPDLLHALPTTPVNLEALPEHLTRKLFEVLRLQIRYDRHTNTATCRVTLTADTIDATRDTAHHATAITQNRKQQHTRQTTTNSAAATTQTAPSVPIHVVPRQDSNLRHPL